MEIKFRREGETAGRFISNCFNFENFYIVESNAGTITYYSATSI